MNIVDDIAALIVIGSFVGVLLVIAALVGG